MIHVNENVKKVEKFKELESGWDGFKAKPLPLHLIDKALAIIPTLQYQPQVFPTARQSIQIEYEKVNGDYLEFELYTNKVEVFAVVDGEEIEEEYTYEQIDWNFIIAKFL